MKRILLMMMSVLFLSACQIQTVEHFEEQQQQIEKSVQSETVRDEVEEDEQAVVTQNEPTTSVNEEDTAVTSATAQLEKQPTPTEAEEAASTTTEAPTNPSVGQQEQQTETPTTSQQPQQDAVEPDTKPSTPEMLDNTVSISIDAKTLLHAVHYEKLQRALQSEQYVPKDGVILAPTQYEIVREGETVFDILQRAVREFNIHMEVQGADENIYDSVYIEGIHHLYEFSAGNLSGWVYQVNGVAPSVGASQYEVKPGDVIRWRYTVDLGRDLDGVEL